VTTNFETAIPRSSSFLALARSETLKAVSETGLARGSGGWSLESRNQIFVELLQGKKDNKLQPRISPIG
jgi:hypothetical protein